MGHPQELRLNFEVIYPSGIIILTETPAIVEITDTSARVGHPAVSISKTNVTLSGGGGLGVGGGAGAVGILGKCTLIWKHHNCPSCPLKKNWHSD